MPLGSNEANIKAVITAEDKASRVLKNFSGGMVSFAKKASFAALGVGTAVAGIGALMVKSFTESENVIAQTNAVLKSTKSVAGVTAKQVSKLASSMQKVTKFSDEEIQSGENLLLTFTKIGKDIFPQATEIMLDMSQALGQDLKSSAVQLGKALQDPILGVTALRRVGVNFSDAQRDVIKNLVDTGRSAEAQKLIMKELQTEFGGSAKAAGETFAGKLTILRNQIDDVKEGIGQMLVAGLSPLATSLANFVASDKFQLWLKQLNDWLAVNIPKAMNYLTNEVIPFLQAAFDATWPIVKTLLSWLGQLIKFLSDHTWIVSTFAAALITVKGALIGIQIAAGIKGALGALKAFVGWAGTAGAAGLGPLALAIGGIVADLYLIIKAKDAVVGALRAIQDAANAKKGLEASNAAVHDRLVNLSKTGSAAQKKRANALLGQGFAEGGQVAGGRSILVGERGPEIFTPPQSGRIIPNEKIGVGGNANIIVNIGMYAGTEIEKRKIALSLMRSFKEAGGTF